jgi:uncharacterized protein (DUF58 family)
VFRTVQIVLGEKAPKLECTARDLSALGVRLCLATTYGIPHAFDVIIGGSRKPARSVWRTCTEIGVLFSEPSRRSADFIQHEREIAPLIELLKMASETWPTSERGDISESEIFRRDEALLAMWPEACRRAGVPVHEFPIGVIRRWQKEMGAPH